MMEHETHTAEQQSEQPTVVCQNGGCSNTPQDTTRRTFLGAAVAFFGVLWAGIAAGIPLFKYLEPKVEAPVVVDKLVLGKDAEFPPGSSKNFKFGSFPALFIRQSATEMYVYNATCSHLGCTVQYADDKKIIFCACHGGQYDPKSGKNVSGPPPAPLKPLKAALEEGDIVIRPA